MTREGGSEERREGGREWVRTRDGGREGVKRVRGV